MLLKGSCHCKAVRFSVESETPYPYQACYCSICRKTAGGGGYAINIMGKAETLKVKGRTRIYHATRGGPDRHFCPKCGSALWLWHRHWAQWVYPFASAIDTKLPAPKERFHVSLASKASWVPVPKGRSERHFREFSKESIIDWHRRRGLLR
jgi:hypothetical protein